MKINYTKGLHLPGYDLWLDSRTSQPVGVVTHAHSDHAAWHAQTITTPATAALMRSRRPDRDRAVYKLTFGKTKPTVFQRRG